MSCKALWSAVLFGLVLAVASAQQEDNLVRNQDFEDGTVDWSLWVEDGNAAAVMTPDKKERQKGKQSLLIDIAKAGAGMRVELHQRHFNLKKGQTLTFALWAKSEATRPAKLICNHRNPPWTSYGSKAITIGTDWQEHWTAVNMPADDALVGIYVELRDQKGKVWFDNVRFYEGEYVAEKGTGDLPRAVRPSGRMPVVWAGIKGSR